MPDWLAIILLGIIEGVTEFLPISSTGHLLIPQNLHWLPQKSELFNVVIQSGAVLAVLAVFTQRLKHLATTLGDPSTRSYLAKLFVSFFITAVGGLVIKKLNIKLPETVPPVAWATFIGGIIILVLEFLHKDKKGTAEITWAVVVAVALAQLLAAVFPGTSRSGASILMALAFGVSRPAATEFSFLLGIPTLMAAGAFKVLSAIKDGEAGGEDWAMVALGTVVAAVSAFIVVKWLIRFVQGHTFNGFAWYRIVMGGALLAWVYTGGGN
ncbi:undecaprenyl-diphosphate phosphatase [Prosthecobacter vanneervenii]|uniref:Undecaprenyl-diphosphatase n=1 Tax=Prosthecobacter vanneervenii TaxID=48466 RepID=A0A7W8DMR3_9BACT|nr:undecaprenyl-diphosphate phosphatase [Prosthecobacter vanneervenii]MBB5035628.1 undecaprenyl-diphosphatase [Prosthecobacter vanneervenii]